MPSRRYKYCKSPPLTCGFMVFSEVEQLVYNALLSEANSIPPYLQDSDINKPVTPLQYRQYMAENGTESSNKVEDSTIQSSLEKTAGDAGIQSGLNVDVPLGSKATWNEGLLEDNFEEFHDVPLEDTNVLPGIRCNPSPPALDDSQIRAADGTQNNSINMISNQQKSAGNRFAICDSSQSNQQNMAPHQQMGGKRKILSVIQTPKKTSTNTKPLLDFATPLGNVKTKSAKHSKQMASPKNVSVMAARYEKHIVENSRKIHDLVKQAKYMLCITTHDKWGGDYKLNGFTTAIQISLAMEPSTVGQWESFIIPLSTNISTHSTQYFRSILWSCFEYGRPVCNHAKSLLSQLIECSLLTPEDIANLKFDDICLTSWLLNSDNFSRGSCIYASISNEKDGQGQLAERLHQAFLGQSAELKTRNMWQVYHLELALVSILISMESHGLNVDMAQFDSVDRLMSMEIRALEKKSVACVGSPISLNSTAQLRQVLYDRLKLDKNLPKTTLYKTAKGQETSTSEGMLNQLVPYHPLPSIILSHRQLYKVHSTYITGMRSFISGGLVKTHWDQTAASTGRLQSTKPNIQSIPKTSISWLNEAGECVDVCPRSVYKSRDGYTFVAVDFKQIEFRIFAHISRDTRLTEVLRDDSQDIFCNLSAIWMGKKACEVTEADREKTKRIVYSVMYGVGKYRLSQQLNITPMEAQSVMSRFLADFPGIQRFSTNVINSCKRKGYAESILGRQRVLPSINSTEFKQRSHAERQSVNFTIQGSAADICKLVMREISAELRQKDVDASLLVQIHDELLYEVVDRDLRRAKDIFISCMETDGGPWYSDLVLTVPLRVAVKSGKNWARMESY